MKKALITHREALSRGALTEKKKQFRKVFSWIERTGMSTESPPLDGTLLLASATDKMVDINIDNFMLGRIVQRLCWEKLHINAINNTQC